EPSGVAVGIGEARQHRRPAQRFDPIGADAVEVLVEADDPAVEDPDPARSRPLGVEGVGVEVGEDRVDSHGATLIRIVHARGRRAPRMLGWVRQWTRDRPLCPSARSKASRESSVLSTRTPTRPQAGALAARSGFSDAVAGARPGYSRS